LGSKLIHDVLISPLNKIANPKGDIYHALKSTSPGYVGFGEVYFSEIKKDVIKGWKKHNRLILNIVVPVGKIEFVLYDDRIKSISRNTFCSIVIGSNNYSRLTVPSGIWIAFRGLEDFNMLMNVISEEHDFNESENVELNSFQYSW
jgi:dTDP-4-dehydrorhamnose 3,5-epimerase